MTTSNEICDNTRTLVLSIQRLKKRTENSELYNFVIFFISILVL